MIAHPSCRYLKLASIGLSATVLSWTAAANILLNPGFESGSGSDATTWLELGTSANASAGRSTSDPFSGTASAYMEVNNVGNPTPPGAAVFVEQNLGANTIDNGKLYNLTFYAKSDSTDFTGINCFAQIQWLDQDGSDGGGFKGETLQSLIGFGPGLGTTYQKFELTNLQPAPGSDSFLVRFQLAAGAIPEIDNGFYVDDVVLEELPDPVVAEIAQGTVVMWTPTSGTASYQPQESANGVDWTNLGSSYAGSDVSSTFDPDGAAFYRVLESEFAVTDDILNGSFETTADLDPFCGEHWECLSPTGTFDYLPTRIETDARTGIACMQLKVENDAGGAPTKALIIQNIEAQGGSITPGADYTFSFWAKDVSSGISYVQGYAVKWLASGGAVITETGFTNFSGGSGFWQETSINLTAPAGAVTAFIEIAAEIGAVPNTGGEVLIDDVSLTASVPGPGTEIAATSAEGVQVSWNTSSGKNYQVKSGSQPDSLSPIGPVIAGSGSQASFADFRDAGEKYYQVERD